MPLVRWWSSDLIREGNLFTRKEQRKLGELYSRIMFLEDCLDKGKFPSKEEDFRKAELSALNWIIGLIIDIRTKGI